MQHADETLPVSFGRYYLVDRIAEGGMADVYGAVMIGEGGFSKRLAIKRIIPDLFDPAHIDLFTKEARIAAVLQHPNLVEVTDFGRVGEEYYLAMQWVHGLNLDTVIGKLVRMDRGFDNALAVSIACDVAAGLHYMHTFQGTDGQLRPVVHRDVSPSNILLGFSGAVKLTDFGVAEMIGRDEPRGNLNGKISYMAPELLDGEAATPKSDQYSLGVVLYEMLTMRRLFEYSSDLETISLVKTKDIPPPSAINDWVTPALDDIVMRAIARDPDARFATVEEMRRALVSHQDKPIDLARIMDALFHRERAAQRTRFAQGLQLLQEEGLVDEASGEQEHPPVPRAISGDRQPSPYAPDKHERGTILVVDDVDDNRTIMTRVLKRAGHNVIGAANGRDALGVVDNYPIDAVVLDVNMPGMSGFEVLERIRDHYAPLELPVIMATVNDSSQDVVHGLERGANDYLGKPIDLDILEARVQTQVWAKKSFEALNEASLVYRAVVDSAFEVVVHLTQALTLYFVSPASRRLLGYAPADLDRTAFADLIPEDERARVLGELEGARPDDPIRTIEHRIVLADGAVVPAVTTLAIAHEDDGTWIGFRGSIRPIAE